MEVRDNDEQQPSASGEQALPEVSAEDLGIESQPPPLDSDRARLRAMIEAIIYMTDEPLSCAQIAQGLQLPQDTVEPILAELVEFYERPESGLAIRELAGGYKMSTRPEHHEALRAFVKKLKPPLKLSLAALETLAVIAYKQPITAPEIMDIRGVQGAGVLKTLLDRKLITTAGRKQVVGRPVLYKTTKEFLIQFGLKDLSELPTLKEFEEISRLATGDGEEPAEAAERQSAAPVEQSIAPEERPPAPGAQPEAANVEAEPGAAPS
jgi:segregation and condensation protein B